jgi:hypothetical protein
MTRAWAQRFIIRACYCYRHIHAVIGGAEKEAPQHRLNQSTIAFITVFCGCEKLFDHAEKLFDHAGTLVDHADKLVDHAENKASLFMPVFLVWIVDV